MHDTYLISILPITRLIFCNSVNVLILTDCILIETMFVRSILNISRRGASGCTTSRTFSVARKFNILGIQQVAIGGLSKQKLSEFWVDTLGVTKVGEYKAEKENVDEDILVLGTGTNRVEIDLMQPLDPDRAPKVHIPALNHLGLWVDDIHAAVDDLTEKGIKFTPGGVRKGAAGYDVCFIHPKSAVGVLIELVQAPQDVIDASKK